MHTLPDFRIGGTAKLVKQIIGFLSRERFENHICVFAKNDQLKAEFEELNVPILFIEYKGIHSFFGTLTNFRKALKQNQIDIIHNNLFLDRIISSISAFKRGSVITSLHATDNPYRATSIKKNSLSFIEDIVGRFFTTKFIAVSDAVATNAVKNRFVPQRKIDVIYSGISLDEFSINTRRDMKERQYLISVGRLTKAKGHQDVIKAFLKISREYPELKLLIVGEGGYREELEGLIAKCSLVGRVLLLGSRKDIPGLLAGAKLFISASYEEGFGISLIEAMASQVPVIGYRLEAFEKIVTSGVDGILVEVGDFDAIADQIVRVLEDPVYYNNLSISGQETVHRNHDMKKVIKKYEAVYESVCGV